MTRGGERDTDLLPSLHPRAIFKIQLVNKDFPPPLSSTSLGPPSTNLLRPCRSVSSPSLCRIDSTVSESLRGKTHRGKREIQVMENPAGNCSDGGEGKVQEQGSVSTEGTPKPSPNM